MDWLDYCEHCGTTNEPIPIHEVDLTLDGNSTSEGNSKIVSKKAKRKWKCSVCGRILNIDGDEK